jgi:hypothetical protein
MALLAAALAIPAALAGGGFLLLQGRLGLWSAAPATVLFLGSVAVEAALVVQWLGGVFERTDPASAGIA